jgi:hypothetical protein
MLARFDVKRKVDATARDDDEEEHLLKAGAARAMSMLGLNFTPTGSKFGNVGFRYSPSTLMANGTRVRFLEREVGAPEDCSVKPGFA